MGVDNNGDNPPSNKHQWKVKEINKHVYYTDALLLNSAHSKQQLLCADMIIMMSEKATYRSSTTPLNPCLLRPNTLILAQIK